MDCHTRTKTFLGENCSGSAVARTRESWPVLEESMALEVRLLQQGTSRGAEAHFESWATQKSTPVFPFQNKF